MTFVWQSSYCPTNDKRSCSLFCNIHINYSTDIVCSVRDYSNLEKEGNLHQICRFDALKQKGRHTQRRRWGLSQRQLSTPPVIIQQPVWRPVCSSDYTHIHACCLIFLWGHAAVNVFAHYNCCLLLGYMQRYKIANILGDRVPLGTYYSFSANMLF